MLRVGGPREGRRSVWSPPLTVPGLLSLVLLLAVAVAMVDVLGYAFRRLGLGPGWATVVLLVSLLGGGLNIPIRELRGTPTAGLATVRWFGVSYLVPVIQRPRTILAVNVGGALVPVALSMYLILHGHLYADATVAVALVAVPVHLAARPLRGVGIAVPVLLPPLAALSVAVLLHPTAVAALAYVGGTLGTLVGADLTHLPAAVALDAPVVAIGGAGTFDGIFVTGVLAVLLTGLL